MNKIILTIVGLILMQSASAETVIKVPSELSGPIIPFSISIDKPKQEFVINITSNGNHIMTFKKTGKVEVDQIASRMRSTAADIHFEISYEDGTQENITNSPVYKDQGVVIPDDAEVLEGSVGGGEKAKVFKKKGIKAKLIQKYGMSGILIANAVSKKHFVNKATLKLKNGSEISYVTIEGSPYWFEPLVIYKGVFDDSEKVEIVSN